MTTIDYIQLFSGGVFLIAGIVTIIQVFIDWADAVLLALNDETGESLLVRVGDELVLFTVEEFDRIVNGITEI